MLQPAPRRTPARLLRPGAVALSKADFARATELRETEGRETETPYFGRLITELPVYSPSTINLKSWATPARSASATDGHKLRYLVTAA
ncbi:DUF2199 domain-containing protein [Kitasatospora aureofaciens]|uniref:DUF2199 domain-containing protein n=1 Tax=Kitasatospora aureofaciens TaxID=1894 RepID=UPI0037C88651